MNQSLNFKNIHVFPKALKYHLKFYPLFEEANSSTAYCTIDNLLLEGIIIPIAVLSAGSVNSLTESSLLIFANFAVGPDKIVATLKIERREVN